MDFGVLGLDGIVGPNNGAPSPSPSPSPPVESKPKLFGSGFTKQERSSDSAEEEDHWKSCKVPKTMPLHQGIPLLRSNETPQQQQDHMISFSSLKSELPFIRKDGNFMEKTTQSNDFSMYTRNAGYGSGNLNATMHGVLTPSQWIELQHQALIYKYIMSNVPVPSNLLTPLKKSLYPYGFTSSSVGSLPYNSLGWGSFHLRYTGSTDPEPGRCRRTDGKKWRCSRDAVADQKYCERHINRGRHRSRKPVEGQTGHTATNSKVESMSSSMLASAKTSGGAANSLAIALQHRSGAADPSSDTLVNRIQDQRGFSVLSSTTNLKSDDSTTFTITKQGVPFVESSLSDFGHVASDSLVNPSHKSYYMNSKEYGHGLFLDFTGQETQDQTPPHQFIDNWPKDQSSRSIVTWPNELKPDWTQLSMSIPMVTSEFSSTLSSPVKEKLDLSSLRLVQEFDQIQMGLGVNNDITEQTKKQPNWIPISWGGSTGGPLGEILNNTTNNTGSCQNSSTLTFLSEGLDGNRIQLQNTPFSSLSNSSSGSSPIAENNKKLLGAASVPSIIRS
ncbi:growth-regulating factor 1 isoform X1 [Gossypium raimondii]|uniref:Growth-regulating factor n=2 Tax=Gossypium raimondii TaxID=29730 RepID=A0A0D2MIR8_GOSRA|nr:growth-regulating factor 1 isoform X1 [Gossypium raimondii]KJB18062.1 hypothetical protein B456_003G032300 [Gossypium raimondii]